METEVSSSAPYLLHNALSDSPIRWRFIFRVLRRPVTALGCVLLKDRNLTVAPREGCEIYPRACLWGSPRTRQHNQYWLTNKRVIILGIPYLLTPKFGSCPTNYRTEPSIASLSAISLPRNPAFPGTQFHLNACGA